MNQWSNSANAQLGRLDVSKPLDSGGSIRALLLEDLSDPNPRVRILAIKELSNYRGSSVIERLIGLAREDEALQVRCAAISGLGSFIYRGGISAYDPETDQDVVCSDECLPKEDFQRVYDFLLSVYQDAGRPLDERRCAVEAQSFFSNDTVEDLIAELYAMPEKAAKRSALVSMGRNGSTRWVQILRKELHNPDRDLQLEAIHAAGETSLDVLGKDLWRLTYSNDKQVRLAAIWSLGQTGWNGALERLDELTLDDDPEVCETADEAMDEWLFYNSLNAGYSDRDADLALEDDLVEPIC